MSFENPSCSFSWAQVVQLGDDLELPDDVCLSETALGQDNIEAFFTHYYDSVADKFLYQFTKVVEGVKSAITITHEMAKRVLFLYARLAQIINRYSGKEMTALHKYEIGTEVYITLGQNSAKFGGRKFIDLRKQYRTEEGKNVPTKVGVRYPVQMLEDIKGVLDASTEMSNKLKRESSKIMNFSKIALIEREVEDLRVLGYNCEGCFTEHPSQDQHMGQGGCMQQTLWSEQVCQYFDQACLGVYENERMLIANATVKKMGLQGLFIEEYEDKPKENLKNMICDETDEYRGDLVYITVKEIVRERHTQGNQEATANEEQ